MATTGNFTVLKLAILNLKYYSLYAQFSYYFDQNMYFVLEYTGDPVRFSY